MDIPEKYTASFVRVEPEVRDGNLCVSSYKRMLFMVTA
jgi:hypothetical protein